MSGASPERNLLFGLLALQNGFITRDQLIAAFGSWTADKRRGLDQILTEQQNLDDPTRDLISALVARHLSFHEGNAAKSLAALSSVNPSARHDLERLNDQQLSLCLIQIPPVDLEKTPDPFATVLQPVGQQSTGGRFVILRPHAAGGLGQVAVALDTELHREVALKEIQPKFADETAARTRFVREAEITGGLEHPGIVPVYGLGAYGDGRPYYAMKFVKGRSLKTALEEFHQKHPHPTAADYQGVEFRQLLQRFLDVCNAMQYAHDRGVLHRDLKPGNIMLGQYGETLVIDWGLAKPLGESEQAFQPTESGEKPLIPQSSLSGSGAETQRGSAIGTLEYMSPEQAAGQLDDLGPATDVYSLGATLYHILTGQPPIEPKKGEPYGEILQSIQRAAYPPPRQLKLHAPKAMEAICLKAMSLASTNRFAVPRELASEVEHWLADEPVSVVAETIADKMSRAGRKHRGVVAAVLAASIVIAAGSFIAALIIDYQRKQNLVLANQNADLAHAERSARELETTARKKSELLAEEMSRLAEEKTRIANDNAEFSQFLVGLFRLSDPLNLRGDGLRESAQHDVLAPLILQRAAERISQGQLSANMRVTLLNGLGDVERSRGALERAESLLREAERLAQEHLPTDDPAVADNILYRGLLAFTLGQVDESEQLLRASIQRREKRLNTDPLATSESEFYLALALSIKGRKTEAEELLRKVVDARSKHLPADSLELEYAKLALAAVLASQQKQYEALLIALEKISVLELGRALLIKQEGIELRKQRKYDEAGSKYRQAIELVESRMGKNHPLLLLMHGEMAGMLKEQGRFGAAMAEIRHALPIFESPFGQFPLFSGPAIEFAEMTFATGNLAEAERILFRARRIAETPFEGRRPNISSAGVHLSKVLSAQGRYEEAEAAARRAMTDSLREGESNAPNPSAYNWSLQHLAIILSEQGKYAEAETAYRTSQPIRGHSTIERHVLTKILREQGKLSEADEVDRSLLDDLRQGARFYPFLDHDVPSWFAGQIFLEYEDYVAAERSFRASTNLYKLSEALIRLDRSVEAVDLLRQELEARLRTWEQPHYEHSVVRNLLAQALWKSGQQDEGQTVAQQAFEVTRSLFNQDHPWMINAHLDYADLLKLFGEHDSAESHYQTAQEHAARIFPAAHPLRWRSLKDRAANQIAAGQFQTAGQLLKAGLVDLESVLPEKSPRLAELRAQITSLPR